MIHCFSMGTKPKEIQYNLKPTESWHAKVSRAVHKTHKLNIYNYIHNKISAEHQLNKTGCNKCVKYCHWFRNLINLYEVDMSDITLYTDDIFIWPCLHLQNFVF